MTSHNFEIFNITKHNKKFKKKKLFSCFRAAKHVSWSILCLPNKQHSTMPRIPASMELRTK